MQDKINERRGFPKLVGLAVAGATLLAGMVALPATQASALGEADNFHEGAIDSKIEPKLTVTKYLSGRTGNAPTGSITDAPASGSGVTTAKDIVFDLTEIEPKTTVADINPNLPSTYNPSTRTDAIKATGITDGDGVINSWYKAQTSGANQGQPDTSKPVTLPGGLHYFLLEENRTASPAFKAGGTLDPNKYAESAKSFFGLPYKTTDGTKDGYIYHLHVYPKNVSNSSVDKSVSAINGNANLHVARAGDTITYKVTQKIYNTGTATPNDKKLDISELAGGYGDLRVVDKMGASLKLDPNTVDASIKTSTTSLPLNASTAASPDYKVSTSTDKFDRIANNAPAGSKLFASDNDSHATYTAFDFFRDASVIRRYLAGVTDQELTIVITYKATVTPNGDSSGAGGVVNSVESDIKDNSDGTGPVTPPGGGTVTASGSVAFGKLKKGSTSGTVEPLEGAVFRLADPTDPAKFLDVDGTFKADGTDGAKFFNATSNAQGLVAFTGLPILDGSGVGVAGNWDVVEYSAPSGFSRAPNPFAKVMFDNRVVGKSADDIVASFGNAPIQPDYTKLSFGTYGATTTPATPIKFQNNDVAKYMMNYKTEDSDTPAGLPLTGGRGIILLLVVGVIIMGGVLYVRSRRNAARA